MRRTLIRAAGRNQRFCRRNSTFSSFLPAAFMALVAVVLMAQLAHARLFDRLRARRAGATTAAVPAVDAGKVTPAQPERCLPRFRCLPNRPHHLRLPQRYLPRFPCLPSRLQQLRLPPRRLLRPPRLPSRPRLRCRPKPRKPSFHRRRLGRRPIQRCRLHPVRRRLPPRLRQKNSPGRWLAVLSNFTEK